MSFLVNNTGTNYSLYYNVLDYFRTIMVNHPSLRDVSQGPLGDIDDVQYPFYPLGNIQIVGAEFQPSSTDYKILLIITS